MNDDYLDQLLSIVGQRASSAYGGQPLPLPPKEEVAPPASGFERFTTGITGMQDPKGANSEFWRGMMQMGLGTMAAAGRPGASVLSSFGEGGQEALSQLEKRRLERDQTRRQRKQDLLEGYKTIFNIGKDEKDTSLKEKNLEYEGQKLGESARHNKAMEGLYGEMNAVRERKLDAAGNPQAKIPVAIPQAVQKEHDAFLKDRMGELQEGADDTNLESDAKQQFRERANQLYQQSRNPDEARRMAWEELKQVLKKKNNTHWYNPGSWGGANDKFGLAGGAPISPPLPGQQGAPVGAAPRARNPKTGEELMFNGTAWVPAK